MQTGPRRHHARFAPQRRMYLEQGGKSIWQRWTFGAAGHARGTHLPPRRCAERYMGGQRDPLWWCVTRACLILFLSFCGACFVLSFGPSFRRDPGQNMHKAESRGGRGMIQFKPSRLKNRRSSSTVRPRSDDCHPRMASVPTINTTIPTNMSCKRELLLCLGQSAE